MDMVTEPQPPRATLLHEFRTSLQPLTLAEHFPTPQPLEVELGCGDGSFLVEWAQRNPGRNLLGVDPGLQPLEWTSPFVGVVPILFGSAAWNTGNPSFTPPPATDQRGLPRVVDIIDIGAYEVQEAVLLPKFTG